MEHLAALMLLVGCSGDVSVCKEIPTSVPAYQNVADCQADLPIQIRMIGSADKRVYGACKAVSADLFEQPATIDWAVSRDGRLMVDVTAKPQQVASR